MKSEQWPHGSVRDGVWSEEPGADGAWAFETFGHHAVDTDYPRLQLYVDADGDLDLELQKDGRVMDVFFNRADQILLIKKLIMLLPCEDEP